MGKDIGKDNTRNKPQTTAASSTLSQDTTVNIGNIASLPARKRGASGATAKKQRGGSRQSSPVPQVPTSASTVPPPQTGPSEPSILSHPPSGSSTSSFLLSHSQYPPQSQLHALSSHPYPPLQPQSAAQGAARQAAYVDSLRQQQYAAQQYPLSNPSAQDGYGNSAYDTAEDSAASGSGSCSASRPSYTRQPCATLPAPTSYDREASVGGTFGREIYTSRITGISSGMNIPDFASRLSNRRGDAALQGSGQDPSVSPTAPMRAGLRPTFAPTLPTASPASASAVWTQDFDHDAKSANSGARAAVAEEASATIDAVEWRLIETYVAFVHAHWPILAVNKPSFHTEPRGPATSAAQVPLQAAEPRRDGASIGLANQQQWSEQQPLVTYIASLKTSNPILFNAALAVVSATFEAEKDMKPRSQLSSMGSLDPLNAGDSFTLAGTAGGSFDGPSPGPGGVMQDVSVVTRVSLSQTLGLPATGKDFAVGEQASQDSANKTLNGSDPFVRQHARHTGDPHDLSRSYADESRSAILPIAHTRLLWVVQTLLLLALADLGAGRMAQAFMMSGMACRLALDMSLHRVEGETILRMERGQGEDVEEEITLRRRAFWACYILDKAVSCVTEKPFVLRSSDIDVPFPSTNTTDEVELWLNTTSASFVQHRAIPELKLSRSYRISVFVAWAKLMIILEYILDELYSLPARRSAQAGMAADMRPLNGRDAGDSMEMKFRSMLRLLGEWAEELPEEIRWHGLFPGHDNASRHARTSGANPHRGVGPNVLTLRAWASLCMLALHRPFIPRNVSNGSQGEAVSSLSALSHPAQACISAADEILNLVDAFESTFPVRKIPSGWVFLVFSSATIYSSFGTASMPQQPIYNGLVDATMQQQQYRLTHDTALHCQRQLNRCIERLKRISETHKGAAPDVEILRNLSDVRNSIAGSSNAAESTSQKANLTSSTSADAPAFYPAQPPPHSAFATSQQQRQPQLGPYEHANQHSAQPQQESRSAYDSMNEGFMLEGFWNSMPFGESWDSWRSYFNHLQPTITAPVSSFPQ
ncbi:hypothetical protein K437DRAFT_266605 [Tilletiaria anomala UBC 951]|uniref:Xylanolytic transcriptional activator regulatory domain-containing protein n=1 Tax=Tilletiaria anomala (strain ATCC 24038 / CBS 436.72 / UBC 951) TaxID=1037660 RepID=A0A066WIP9_TILAU|nr:uncharacterized protein K437DRAFT_266605 [Tilletiaria anomala UBC 951]KDN52413.1 hypothetical protein K437DRAFT_266605 [Tilletiaria anomala UBC 951]